MGQKVKYPPKDITEAPEHDLAAAQKRISAAWGMHKVLKKLLAVRQEILDTEDWDSNLAYDPLWGDLVEAADKFLNGI